MLEQTKAKTQELNQQLLEKTKGSISPDALVMEEGATEELQTVEDVSLKYDSLISEIRKRSQTNLLEESLEDFEVVHTQQSKSPTHSKIDTNETKTPSFQVEQNLNSTSLPAQRLSNLKTVTIRKRQLTQTIPLKINDESSHQSNFKHPPVLADNSSKQTVAPSAVEPVDGGPNQRTRSRPNLKNADHVVGNDILVLDSIRMMNEMNKAQPHP